MPADELKTARLDSARLRTLAHPLRSRLLTTLRANGPGTATTLAARLGTNTGATSYHLRKLADVGLIEEDPEHAGGRERWWRSAHERTTWTDTSFDDDPNDRAAADWLVGHIARLYNRWLEDWLATRRLWSSEWRDAANNSDHEFHLTPERLRALNAELQEVLDRYSREADPSLPDSQRCAILLHSFPMPLPQLDPDAGQPSDERPR